VPLNCQTTSCARALRITAAYLATRASIDVFSPQKQRETLQRSIGTLKHGSHHLPAGRSRYVLLPCYFLTASGYSSLSHELLASTLEHTSFVSADFRNLETQYAVLRPFTVLTSFSIIEEFVNAVVSKSAGDVILKQLDVSFETTKEGTVFKKAKSVKVPRVLVVTQFKLYLFDATGKSLKEKRVRLSFRIRLLNLRELRVLLLSTPSCWPFC